MLLAILKPLLVLIVMMLVTYVARYLLLYLLQSRIGGQPGASGGTYGGGYSRNGRTRAGRSAYEVLQVSPEAAPGEIRAAYHRLVQLYHPDKVAELGPELREVAEQHMKEINAAYQELKQRHDL